MFPFHVVAYSEPAPLQPPHTLLLKDNQTKIPSPPESTPYSPSGFPPRHERIIFLPLFRPFFLPSDVLWWNFLSVPKTCDLDFPAALSLRAKNSPSVYPPLLSKGFSTPSPFFLPVTPSRLPSSLLTGVCYLGRFFATARWSNSQYSPLPWFFIFPPVLRKLCWPLETILVVHGSIS